ncbi:MAG: PLP-dependent aminotransferase family protein [Spirochaetia bacterium]|nr:PLP-dependent aminotransferase family protein [Spirochaetia bacterium]NCC89590.1 PLP-dependent aminotransferase family protein [Spirochaetia bacterium]
MSEIPLMLERNDPRTLTEQLYDFLKAEILDGSLASKEKLPSKRMLAQSLKCSITTIQAAYNQLVDEGYLIAKEKSGYYVAELSGIVHLGGAQGELPPGEKPSEQYRYDFSYHGVDFDHFPFQLWRRVMREVVDERDRDLLRMGDAKGDLGLRTSIAHYLHQSRGVQCEPSQIVVSAGTEYLLQLLIQLLAADTSYGIENPGYEKLSQLFRSSRIDCRPLALDEQGLRVEAMEGQDVDVVCITPSHQFPTGCIMTVARRLQLLSWAAARSGRYIIEDDYDSEFRYAGKPIPSLQGMDRNGRVIYIGAFSKSLSPALRISYMVLPKLLCKTFDETMLFLNCPVPMIEQKVLALFMQRGHFERHLNRMRNLYKQKREVLVDEISKQLPSARIQGSAAGLHLTIQVDNGMEEDVLETSAKQHGVNVYGLSRYYSELSQGEMDGRVLLGFATIRIEEIADAVALLRAAWNQGSVVSQ